MAKFTQGKWHAFMGENSHSVRLAHTDDKEGHDYGNGTLIAHVFDWRDGYSWGNARLIAHAPEMYQLLLDCAEHLSHIGFSPLADKCYELLDKIDGKDDIRGD